MKQFKIEIPNERLKTYKIVTFLILTLNFLGFGYVFVQTTGMASIIAIVAILINAVPWAYYLLNKKHIKSPIIEITFIASAVVWLYFGNYWMGAMLLVFGIIGFFANKKPIIIFTEDGIEYPSFPVKKYSWQEVTQVLWKDDILTIDMKDNKLLQFNIEKEFSSTFDEKAFNHFCKEYTMGH